MNIAEIQSKLDTKFIGKKIEYFETIESTHLYSKKMLEKDIVDGMVIFADNQTGGVGTHERKWFTGEGENLSFDIILTPNCDIQIFSELTVIIANSVRKAIKELYNIETEIKKPNDVILNNKKIAGIITESVGMRK